MHQAQRNPTISLIVAHAKNRVIGHQGQMPWHLPSDLAYFKETTMGCPVIMGRLTWESIGRPLPGRLNIVISRQSDYTVDGAVRVSSLSEALALAKNHLIDSANSQGEIFIIGGAQIYAQALAQDLVDRLYITEIQQDFEGDATFAAIEPQHWQEIKRHPRISENGVDFDFLVYERRPRP